MTTLFDEIYEDGPASVLTDTHGETVTYLHDESGSEITAILGDEKTETDPIHGLQRVRYIIVSNTDGKPVENDVVTDDEGRQWIVSEILSKTSTFSRVKAVLAEAIDGLSVIPELLRHSLAVTRRVRTTDGQGGFTEVYTSIGNWFAAIRPATAQERESATRMEVDLTHMATMQSAAAIQRNDRVAWTDELGSHTADVDAVTIPDASEYITAELSEIVRGG